MDTVIGIGTVTSICCESTARSAFMRDYKVAFIGDANGVPIPTDRYCSGRQLRPLAILADKVDIRRERRGGLSK